MLARREHSRGELERKLSAKGFPGGRIGRVIEELAAAGLQSDARYTEAYVNERIRKGFGPLYITRALRSRGVDASLIERYLDWNASEWSRRAAALVHRRYGSMADADRGERAKAARFLQQRGFTGEQVRRALSEKAED